MLPRENRLKKKKDFERVFKIGKGCGGPFLFLKFYNNNLKVSRFGFVVSAKVSKKAVTRNKIKRQLREIIRLKLVKIKTGYDFIILTNPGIVKKDYREIDKAITDIFQKANLFTRQDNF